MPVERVVGDELREVPKGKCTDSEGRAFCELPTSVLSPVSCLLIKRQREIESRPECEENVLLSHHGHQRAREPERYNASHGPRLAHAEPDRHEQRNGECRAGV